MDKRQRQRGTKRNREMDIEGLLEDCNGFIYYVKGKRRKCVFITHARYEKTTKGVKSIMTQERVERWGFSRCQNITRKKKGM